MGAHRVLECYLGAAGEVREADSRVRVGVESWASPTVQEVQI